MTTDSRPTFVPPWRDLDALAAAWRAMIEAREEQVRRLIPARAQPTADFWSARAPEFRSLLHVQQPSTDAVFARLRSLVDADTAVLDVGAGVGRYALPIASDVREVIAVEPSQGMRAILEEETAARGLRNIRSVAATWEEAQVGPADVVICSHVMYSARDIVGFVRKLRDHARRSVLIALRIDQFDTYFRDLWRELYGEPRALEPTFVELYPILYALGVSPNVEVTSFGANRAFATLEEAEERVAALADAPPERIDAVRRFVRERMRQNADDAWEWDAPPIRSAIAWWDETSLS